METQADIGVIGLAVMGQNLVLNMLDHGFRVAVYNRTVAVTQEFVAAAAKPVIGTESIADFVAALQRPRRLLLMVKAGAVVDAVIEQLLPLLEPGDTIIDGGNSLYTDTERRVAALAEQGIHFIGCGVSGGEVGARNGPSIMPGGARQAWPLVQPVLQRIAAQVDGQPCCQWIGDGGAGHYVKMVHNGIEYGDMQLIAEAYQLLHEGLAFDAAQLHETFAAWNQGVLESYLIEISADIFTVMDSDGEPLLDKVMDTAGQKGTGKWTAVNALQLGMPLTLIGEAVFARFLSALKDERGRAAQQLKGSRERFEGDVAGLVSDIHDALYAAKIISYAQGFQMLRAAAAEYGWQLDLAAIASVWRGGCIIRSRFLNDISAAYRDVDTPDNLLLAPFFTEALRRAEPGWRRTVARAVQAGLPVPAFAAALCWYDGYRSERLPANLIQAQRDYFGAHTYERIDKPRGEFFHTDWAGTGGKVSSTTYQA